MCAARVRHWLGYTSAGRDAFQRCIYQDQGRMLRPLAWIHCASATLLHRRERNVCCTRHPGNAADYEAFPCSDRVAAMHLACETGEHCHVQVFDGPIKVRSNRGWIVL